MPQRACDPFCPSLKEKRYIQSLLANKEVWMCHKFSQRPCVGTELNHVPEGHEKIQTQLI